MVYYKAQTLRITNLCHRLETDEQTTNKALQFLHNAERKQTDVHLHFVFLLCVMSLALSFSLVYNESLTGKKEKRARNCQRVKEEMNRERDECTKGNTQREVGVCMPLCQQ